MNHTVTLNPGPAPCPVSTHFMHFRQLFSPHTQSLDFHPLLCASKSVSFS